MITKNKNTATPRLRFPAFQDDEAWELKNGDKVFDQISNKNHNSDLAILAITQEFGAIPRDKIDYTVIATDRSIESYKVVEVGDFIISLRSFQGGIEYSNFKGICSPAYIILRKKIKVSDNFYKYYFKTDIFIKDLNRNIEGIRDGKMVSYKQFSELFLPTPTITEQQKIADCLSSLDDVINVQSEKINALKAHKKGLMQQLFPAEGEKIPRLRFPEFQDDEMWVEKELGELCTKISSGSDKNNPSGDFDLYGSTGIIGKTDCYSLNGNFILIARVGANAGSLNKVSGKFGVTDNTLILFLDKFQEIDFVYNLLGRFSLNNIVFGSGQPLITSGQLKNLKFYFPPTINEQQKIADCLSLLDDVIKASSDKLDAFKVHKKGLMQQLFPNINDLRDE